MCVIILDEGVVDDHMPNNVMDSLILLSNNMGMKPHCGELVELKKISKLDPEANNNVYACTEKNGKGITEENELTDTRIVLEEKYVEKDEPEENGVDEMETSFSKQIVVPVDVNV